MKKQRFAIRQMNIIKVLMVTVFLVYTCGAVSASEPGYKSKYIGQEKREIKSLSNEDIAELKTGAGWGLAKAAELNGLPGPKHVLEMKSEIGLTAEQERKVTDVFLGMNGKAVALGNAYIEYEKELDRRFAARDIDDTILDELLEKISKTYKALRFTHLSAHLQTVDILTGEQVRKYNEMRGYAAGDPCANIPPGHDPVRWRKHNNCN